MHSNHPKVGPYDNEPPTLERWFVVNIAGHQRVGGMLPNNPKWVISGKLKKLNEDKKLAITEDGAIYRLGERDRLGRSWSWIYDQTSRRHDDEDGR